MIEGTPRPRWSSTAKLLISAGLVAISFYLLWTFRVVIPPIVLASILAYVLSPLVNRVQSWLRIPRGIAIALAYVLLLGLIAIVPILLAPTVIDQLKNLDLYFATTVEGLEGFLDRVIVVGGYSFNGAQLLQQLVTTLRGMLEPVFGETLGIAFDVITSAVWVVFVFVISFYLIKDGKSLLAWVETIPPDAYREDIRCLRTEIDRIWSAFFIGQLTLALVVSAIMAVLGLIIGLPFALAMALLAGLLEFMPSIGHAIWLTVASLLMFFRGSTWLPVPHWLGLIILIVLHVIFQQVDLNYLIPRIIGRRVHLHPLVMILGIVAGASLAGVLGVVVAAPTIASARVIGRYLLANLFDQEPFEGSLRDQVRRAMSREADQVE